MNNKKTLCIDISKAENAKEQSDVMKLLRALIGSKLNYEKELVAVLDIQRDKTPLFCVNYSPLSNFSSYRTESIEIDIDMIVVNPKSEHCGWLQYIDEWGDCQVLGCIILDGFCSVDSEFDDTPSETIELNIDWACSLSSAVCLK